MTRLVAAVGEELGPLRGTVLGVGLVAAATATARLVATDRPDAVVLVGAAGAYAGGPPVGTVVVASEVLLGSDTLELLDVTVDPKRLELKFGRHFALKVC